MRRTFSQTDTHERIEIAVQVSKLYYKQNLQKNQIAQRLNLTDTRTVNQFIDYAQDRGIVNISIGEVSGVYIQPERDTNLEKKLARRFNTLGDAIVVKVPPYRESYDPKEDDWIHQVLGRALAEELRTIIRPSDRIGVTGGRATSACAQSIRVLGRKHSLSAENVIVVALSGGISRIPEIPPAKLLSADSVAFTMATGLKGAIPRLLSVPWIALSGKAEYPKFPAERFISEKGWKQDQSLIPDVAIAGIGVIKENLHPFFYEDKPELEPVRDVLLTLKDRLNAIGYDAIGDLGQRLFIIYPPEEGIEEETVKELEKLTDEINAQIVAPSFEQLKEIKLLIAIAGGEYKRDAIWTVLTKPKLQPIVDRLCTDSETAQWLLDRSNVSD